MDLTDRAGALWASYEAEVRRALAGRSDVDVGDVLSGVREHVEAELSRRGLERATGEDMAEVLERVGGPSRWGEAGVESGAGVRGGALASGSRAGLAALGLVLVGGLLVLSASWWAWAPGWGLLVSGVTVARVSLSEPGTAAGPTHRLTVVIWWLAVLVGVAAVLLAPAALTWVSAQIGGWLEQSVAGRPGVPGAPGTAGYWRLPAAVAAGSTGVWWLALGAGVARFGDGIRRFLGPARSVLGPGTGRVLGIAGAVLLIAGLASGVLA